MKKAELIKNTINELINGSIEYTIPTIAAELLFPTSGLNISLATTLAKGIMQTIMLECYDDLLQRPKSVIETRKLDFVFVEAEKTYWELACQNEWNNMVTIPVDESYKQYAWETAEHMVLEGMKQYEIAKMKVLGRFYGKTFYRGRSDWNNIHQQIMMAGMLSYRQIVLINLLVNNFYDICKDKFISNPMACVEINQMVSNGICRTKDLIWDGTDNSYPIQLSFLQPTKYAYMLSSDLMLEKLDNNDINRIIETLDLTSEGTPKEVVSKDILDQGVFWENIE